MLFKIKKSRDHSSVWLVNWHNECYEVFSTKEYACRYICHELPTLIKTPEELANAYSKLALSLNKGDENFGIEGIVNITKQILNPYLYL